MQVFFTSPWVPAEWIKAHGLEPRGVWHAKNLWQDALPLAAGVCAFAEATVRFAEAQPDAGVIFPTTCDQMRRGFDALAAARRSRAFLFNIPATWQTFAARQIYLSEVERLGKFLEDLGGRAPLPADLRREMKERSQARDRLLGVARSCPARQFAELVARFHWDGSASLPETATAPATGVPLAILGGPFSASQWNLLEVIEAAGGRVALNATEAGERSLWPAVAVEDLDGDLVGALAQDYFENMVDVFQRPNTRLYSWLKQHVAPRGVRGIVLWLYTGCDLWRAETQTLRDTFGLPVLALDADEAQSCSPRDAGRVQAFVEMLK